MAKIHEDFDKGMEYFCQYDEEFEIYLSVSICEEKYDFEGFNGHNTKEYEYSRLIETRCDAVKIVFA